MIRQRRCRFGRTEIDRLGHQQPLRFQRARQYPFAQLFVEHSFVQGVLIDDHDAVVRFGNQIAIVDLHGRNRLRRNSRRRTIIWPDLVERFGHRLRCIGQTLFGVGDDCWIMRRLSDRHGRAMWQNRRAIDPHQLQRFTRGGILGKHRRDRLRFSVLTPDS